jgi:hypothetical protein
MPWWVWLIICIALGTALGAAISVVVMYARLISGFSKMWR